MLHEVSPRRPVSLVSLLQVPHISFPAPPSFYYSEGMHLSRGRDLNHFFAPELGVGMPVLIWLNTLELECAGLLALHAPAYAQCVLLPFEFFLQCGLTDVRDDSR